MAEKTQSPKPQPKSKAAVAPSEPNVFERAKGFLEESWVEIKKVVWPTRKETLKTGLAVLALVAVMTIFLGVIDAILSRLIGWLISL